MQRVLIIDDEESIRDLLESKFRREGLAVDTAATLDQGLASLRSRQPDLIIADVRMRDDRGARVEERLGQDHGAKRIPLILLSARDDRSIDDQVAGMIAQLRKPFRPSQLLALARDYL